MFTVFTVFLCSCIVLGVPVSVLWVAFKASPYLEKAARIVAFGMSGQWKDSYTGQDDDMFD